MDELDKLRQEDWDAIRPVVLDNVEQLIGQDIDYIACDSAKVGIEEYIKIKATNVAGALDAAAKRAVVASDGNVYADLGLPQPDLRLRITDAVIQAGRTLKLSALQIDTIHEILRVKILGDKSGVDRFVDGVLGVSSDGKRP